jgi:hypothetical protein
MSKDKNKNKIIELIEFRNRIKEVLKDYSTQDYMWSEENGDEPDVEDYVDKILKLIVQLTNK